MSGESHVLRGCATFSQGEQQAIHSTVWSIGLLEALTADLDAISAHRSKQQDLPANANSNSISLLPVYDDRPANGGTTMTMGIPANSVATQASLQLAAADRSEDLGQQESHGRSSLQEDIDGLLDGLEVGDILDLGLPDALEGAWAAPDLPDPLLRDPFAELSTMDLQAGPRQQDDESSQPGSARIFAGGRADKHQHGTPHKASAVEDDQALSDSDAEAATKGKKVSCQMCKLHTITTAFVKVLGCIGI